MANLLWLDEVLGQLAKHALPPNYVQRFAEELSDHLEDFNEMNKNTESDAYSRLGKPEQVAQAAVVAYRQRSFLGRHSTAAFLVFAVSPVVLMIVVVAAVLILTVISTPKELFGCINSDGAYAIPGLAGLAILPPLMTFLNILIPSILAATFYCKLAQRLGLGRTWWTLVACAVVAACAALPHYGVDLSGYGGYKGVHFTVWIPMLCPIGTFHMSQIVQLLVPLAIGWWLTKCWHDRSQLQLAS